MVKFIILAIVAFFIWNSYSNFLDFDKMKQNAIDTMKQEKTIQTINNTRQERQNAVNDIINN